MELTLTGIQHLHELNNNKIKPHLHKGITLSTSAKINTLRFEYIQVLIADSDDNLQRGVFTLHNTAKIFRWKYHQKILRGWHFQDRASKMKNCCG
jgi:hypothetical protein